MKWFGIPVEDIIAVVDGRYIRVGTVYEWADGSRKDIFDIPTSAFDKDTVRRRPLDADD